MFAQVALRRVHRLHGRPRLHLDFGLHPARDLGPEECQRAGQEHCKQYPAEYQSGPGVQPGHGLAQAFLALRLGFGLGSLHAAPNMRPARNRPPRTAVGTRMPAQARQALRVANTQITPQA
ncbi:hypothetical protein D3C71_1469620 [compost metagenome]